MKYELPPLPYERDALAPHISAETLDFHYDKHHAGYVNKLNNLLKDASRPLEELIRTETGAVFNNAAQIWNHTFYWKSMKPNGGGEPTGAIAKKINEDFGDFKAFKDRFSLSATGHFGSGWAWLVLTPDKKLIVHDTHDATNPLRDGSGKPILTCDVWEHAYYIDYRNDRAKYVNSWWNLVNWDFANKNLEEAMK